MLQALRLALAQRPSTALEREREREREFSFHLARIGTIASEVSVSIGSQPTLAA